MRNSLLKIFGALLLSSLGTQAFAAQYEAEASSMSGCGDKVADANASGGYYVPMNSGTFTFSVNVDSAAKYDVRFHYFSDYKVNKLAVNGGAATSVTFPATTTYSDVTATVKLLKGSNTLVLSSSWGWINLDYIDIELHQAATFSLSSSPVTANSTEAAQKLYSFLYDNFGKKTISGMMTGDMSSATDLFSQEDVKTVYTRSGYHAALTGFDFMNAAGKNAGDSWYTAYTDTALSLAAQLWKKGGIPAFNWHWRDPSHVTDSFYCRKDTPILPYDYSVGLIHNADSSYTWDTTSTNYKNIIRDIDHISKLFLSLQNQGVACIWRPLHEASGGWFWWGANSGPEYVALYRLVYDRMVNVNGVRNLIWVWNTEGCQDLDWYPGDDVVDIIGIDKYNDAYDYQSNYSLFDQIAANFGTKKMLTLSENGPIMDITQEFQDQAVWSWWMTWYQSWSSNMADKTSDAEWKKVMASDSVITLEDMVDWGTYTEPVYVDPCDTLNTATRQEAECADYSGCQVLSSDNYSGEKALNLTENAGYIKFTFNADSANVYKIYVANDSVYGTKDYKCAVNGDTAIINAVGTGEYLAGSFNFKAGDNLVEILPSYTWFVVDYVRIENTHVGSGVESVSAASAMVYPSVVNEGLTVVSEAPATVTVIKADGSMLLQQSVQGSAVIPADKLTKGLLLVKLNGDNFSKTFKVVVK